MLGRAKFQTQGKSEMDLEYRYGETIKTDRQSAHAELLNTMLDRGSCRKFRKNAVPRDLVNLACAAAMAAPTKSDLQQRDIILVDEPELKEEIAGLVSGQTWVADAPSLAVFCGNNRRQRLVHSIRGHPFANDHLDAFFNAAVDAAIALSAFVTAAEACSLGCCPISAVRNEASEVSKLLHLPDHVFPVAGLAFGYPEADRPTISMRLPLSATVHENSYKDQDIAAVISTYDDRREKAQPYGQQRATGHFGKASSYPWSEDKARQYALPEREDFGEFVRSKGFNLD